MLVTIYANIYASAWWTWIVWYWNSWPSCGHIFTKKPTIFWENCLRQMFKKKSDATLDDSPPQKNPTFPRLRFFFWFEVTEISFKQKLGVEGFVLSGAFSQLAWEQFRLENLNSPFITEMNSSQMGKTPPKCWLDPKRWWRLSTKKKTHRNSIEYRDPDIGWW